MATYLAVMKQNGEGCDYTIGCGINVKVIHNVGSFMEAMSKLAETEEWQNALDHPDNYSFNPLDGEMTPDNVTLYHIAGDDSGRTFEALKTRLAKVFEGEKVREEQAKDNAEFERLKKKLGKS